MFNLTIDNIPIGEDSLKGYLRDVRKNCFKFKKK